MTYFSFLGLFQSFKRAHICNKKLLFLSQLFNTIHVSSQFVIFHWPMAYEYSESTKNLTFWRPKISPDFGAIIYWLAWKGLHFLLMNIVFWTFLKVFDIEQKCSLVWGKIRNKSIKTLIFEFGGRFSGWFRPGRPN